MTHHLLVAHGSPDPRHRAMMRTLATLVDQRGIECAVAFLEHDEPSVADALATRSGPVVTLGMLLAPGYHATVDMPALLAAAPSRVTVDDRGPLGTGPWLIPTVDWLVADAGGDADAPVILASAGSTRPEARVALAGFATELQQTRRGEVVVAVASGQGLSLEDAATRLSTGAAPSSIGNSRAVVLPFMIAPGILADRVGEVAARNGLPAGGTLAESPPFVDALVERLRG